MPCSMHLDDHPSKQQEPNFIPPIVQIALPTMRQNNSISHASPEIRYTEAATKIQQEKYLRRALYLKLARLNLLASCSSSAAEPSAAPEEKGEGRFGGRSPLSSRMANNVAHPGVLRSWKTSARSCVVATRQRRASSSFSRKHASVTKHAH